MCVVDNTLQFCLAHLSRDLQFLAEHPEKHNRRYGKRILKAVRESFPLIHRRADDSPENFASLLEDADNLVMGEAITRVPQTCEGESLASRFRQHGESYLRYITNPGIDPTNNVAEQTVRFVMLDRKVTQGTRSEWGRRWLERIGTVIATCRQQGRSISEFLSESVKDWLHGKPPQFCSRRQRSLLTSATHRRHEQPIRRQPVNAYVLSSRRSHLAPIVRQEHPP